MKRLIAVSASLVLLVLAGAGHVAYGEAGSIVGWGSMVVLPPEELTNLVAVAAGDVYSLALKADGSIVAWGSNSYGQCNVPEPNAGFVGVAASDASSRGLKADGSIVAWGWNHCGQCNVPLPNAGFVGVAGTNCASIGLKGVFGDVNVDDRVDLADFDALADSLSGPGVLPPLGCGLTRIDGDWDVDLADFAILQRAFSPPGR